MTVLNANIFFQGNKQLTENNVVKNTPITFMMAQKKSVIVLRRQNDLWDFTTPTRYHRKCIVGQYMLNKINNTETSNFRVPSIQE